MKSIVVGAAALVLIAMVNHASALSGFWYNPANGGIWLTNESGAPFGAVSIISAGNNVKIDPGLFTQIPGATFDPGDLPFGFTYLNFPPTNTAFGLYVGNVITPGTPTADLSGVVYESLNTGVAKPYPLLNFPEPASSVTALLAGTAMVAVSRRRRS
jgi:hypothetical protein